jgi:hypothetical protein
MIVENGARRPDDPNIHLHEADEECLMCARAGAALHAAQPRCPYRSCHLCPNPNAGLRQVAQPHLQYPAGNSQHVRAWIDIELDVSELV